MVFFTVFSVARLFLSKKEQHTEISGTGVLREFFRLMWQGATTRQWSAQLWMSLSPGASADLRCAAKARNKLQPQARHCKVRSDMTWHGTTRAWLHVTHHRQNKQHENNVSRVVACQDLTRRSSHHTTLTLEQCARVCAIRAIQLESTGDFDGPRK